MSAVDLIFKAYDIRGTVPDQVDADLVRRIGAAFARFALDEGGPCERIVVARDMRPTGVELQRAFIEGVTSQGVDAVDLGLGSTDLLFFSSGRLDAPGAMLTASHNPAEYNGIKLCLAGARAVGEDSGLLDIKRLTVDPPAPATEPGAVTSRDMLGEFADHVRSFIDTSTLKPLKVAADAANGMGGLVAPAVFDGLPLHFELLYGELDGTFPNHPADPIQPENQVDLKKLVLDSGADIGLAFDGDADRVFLVDELGEGLPGSLTTAIVAAAVLEKEPGATILHNLICSKAVPEIILESGGTPIRTRVGHSLIKKVMADTGAAFGGEHSGHYYFRDNYRADSGIIAALIVLERMSVTGVPLSEMRKPYERYAASGEINTRVDDIGAVTERVAAAYPDATTDRLDGLTVDNGDWWFNLRPSNTEPLLRLNLEAPTSADVDRHVAEVQALMTSS